MLCGERGSFSAQIDWCSTISKNDRNKSNQNHPSGLERAKALEIPTTITTCSGTRNPSHKTRQEKETLNQYVKIELNLSIISVTWEQSSQRQTDQSIWNIRVPVNLDSSALYNSGHVPHWSLGRPRQETSSDAGVQKHVESGREVQYQRHSL